jgi:hypothetical protein
LADEVATRSTELGTRRKLVLLETRNDLATLVTYLAALAGHHVVLPVPEGGDHTAVVDAYRPDVIVRDGVITHRHRGMHDLHPDLALLLSTSGSTGSPKLVRLSRFNLAANAESIATYLDIGRSDRAATTLPMSYCYGLSVIHSHLLRGAAIILTERSVVDDAFWDLFRDHRGTTFAGVPHTFDLLDRIGFDETCRSGALPDLRYVTQAGGRLPFAYIAVPGRGDDHRRPIRAPPRRPSRHLLDLVAAQAECLAIDQRGRSPAGIRFDMVDVSNRRIAVGLPTVTVPDRDVSAHRLGEQA